MPGPLHGVTVIELAGLGPAPFCAMILADMGADVIRVDRCDGPPGPDAETLAKNPMSRGRRSIAVDITTPEGRQIVLDLAATADVLIEGFRPGVVERLGIGPKHCGARNSRLIYARMTGWGQSGPWSHTAGHDVSYLAITGALAHIGSPDRPPVPPLNVLGDFGGGGMLMAFGIASALFETASSGKGQVIDAAIVDGASLMTVLLRYLVDAGRWSLDRETNHLDGGAPFYNVYECADGRYVAVGPIEPKFSDVLFDGLGIDPNEEMRREWYDKDRWPEWRTRMAALFRTKSRDEWATIFDGTDACLAPVLDVTEAPSHPHNSARDAFTDLGGVDQPAPAPRFSRTTAELRTPGPTVGQHTREVLSLLEYEDATVEQLLRAGVVRTKSA